MSDNRMISLRVPESLYSQIQSRAVANERTVTQEIRLALRNHLQEVSK